MESELIKILKAINQAKKTSTDYDCYDFCLNCKIGFISYERLCHENGHTLYHYCFEGGSLEGLEHILMFVLALNNDNIENHANDLKTKRENGARRSKRFFEKRKKKKLPKQKTTTMDKVS